MNRAGLLIALGLTVVSILAFSLYPGLDLAVARLFFDPADADFPARASGVAVVARNAAMWLTWALCAPAIVALIAKLLWPERPLLVKGRTVAFFLIAMTLSAGLLSNAGFKSHWGRPRPSTVTEFGGTWHFKNWWDPSGECPKNCSFFSGEAATAFWSYAPAALAPPPWRPLAYVGATVFGAATGLLRMSFGGHFLSDVVAAGLVTFIVIWLVYGLIYRWAGTRISDAQVDAALTRAFRPLYRWRMRLSARLRGRRPDPLRQPLQAPPDE